MDVVGPSAAAALALVFLRTNDERAAARLALPSTDYLLRVIRRVLQPPRALLGLPLGRPRHCAIALAANPWLRLLRSCRPDQAMIRATCRCLIMWDHVGTSQAWLSAQMPPFLRGDIALLVRQWEGQVPHSVAQARASAHLGLLAGFALGMGLRWAGSLDPRASSTLQGVAEALLKLKGRLKDPGVGRAPLQVISKQLVENALCAAVQALCLVLAGTGDASAFRLGEDGWASRGMDARTFHADHRRCGWGISPGQAARLSASTCSHPPLRQRSPSPAVRALKRRRHLVILRGTATQAAQMVRGNVLFGNHATVSLSLGMLFMGCSRCSLGHSLADTAYLLMSVFPVVHWEPADNRCIPQLLRHMYALAVEDRALSAIDIDTGAPVTLPVDVFFRHHNAGGDASLAVCRQPREADGAEGRGQEGAAAPPTPRPPQLAVSRLCTPLLLPHRSACVRISIPGPRYQSFTLEAPLALDSVYRSLTLFVKRRPLALPYSVDPNGALSARARLSPGPGPDDGALVKAGGASAAEAHVMRGLAHARTVAKAVASGERAAVVAGSLDAVAGVGWVGADRLALLLGRAAAKVKGGHQSWSADECAAVLVAWHWAASPQSAAACALRAASDAAGRRGDALGVSVATLPAKAGAADASASVACDDWGGWGIGGAGVGSHASLVAPGVAEALMEAAQARWALGGNRGVGACVAATQDGADAMLLVRGWPLPYDLLRLRGRGSAGKSLSPQLVTCTQMYPGIQTRVETIVAPQRLSRSSGRMRLWSSRP